MSRKKKNRNQNTVERLVLITAMLQTVNEIIETLTELIKMLTG